MTAYLAWSLFNTLLSQKTMFQGAKEIQKLMRDVGRLTQGQAEISLPNDDDMSVLDITLRPTSGLYRGGEYTFRLNLPSDYPESAPEATCLTKIYHPNVGDSLHWDSWDSDWTGSVCLNILGSDWSGSSGMQLEHVVQGLLFLLADPEGPNIDDALNSDVCIGRDFFDDCVRVSIEGGYICTSSPDKPPVRYGNEDELDTDETYVKFQDPEKLAKVESVASAASAERIPSKVFAGVYRSVSTPLAKTHSRRSTDGDEPTSEPTRGFRRVRVETITHVRSDGTKERFNKWALQRTTVTAEPELEQATSSSSLSYSAPPVEPTQTVSPVLAPSLGRRGIALAAAVALLAVATLKLQ
eukprot:TRINITY_DN4005_c0_g1_i1.p2 TRINITY_DN4005_c0_g1~~TRINITY_DN4005_c0_g1_i1.p2  ORF type:complete len:354 (-),score=46.52 TRINITY_DN4005_c0_g1_i1:8-1069(-)